jgi:RHS repeat-associated protein
VTYPEANPEQHHAEKVEQFDYDATGNKISETQALAPTPFHANIAKGNRLTFFSDKHFEYDRFGNLIAEKRGKNHSLVTHYQYDCRHRLIKVIKPTGLIITYTYDAFNRRTSKTVDGKTTEFIWQGSRLIAETDNDKHWQSYLYELDSYRPLALVHGNAQQDNIKLYWYQNDHLGTPIALTGSLGDTLYECQYNAYGQIINETYHQDDIDSLPDNPLRFQGQYYDEETGLHYNLNRYYDPFTGRYITQDPLGILGGLNSYQYANGDPINWIDPLGLIKVENNGFEGVAGKGASGSLTGQQTKLPPNASTENIRSLARENESAKILSQNGYHVEQNPITSGVKNLDYKINGEIFDNYAPSSGNIRNIWREVEKKVERGQTNNVVINLADTKATIKDLQKQLNDWPVKGLDKIIVIDQSGKPVRIK